MKITQIEATEVTVPIEAPLRFAYGVHLAFTRTIIQVHTDVGVVGLGETAATADQVQRLAEPLIGLHPFDLEVVRNTISNRFYWSRDPLVAAGVEMALIDIIGKAMDEPAYRVLGGAVRDHIDMAAYCFYRYPNKNGKHLAVSTPEEMAAHARALVSRYGFGTVKLKGGVLPAADEVATMEAIRAELGPDVRLRLDPQSAWTVETAIMYAPRLEAVGLEYYEDPVAGAPSMATVRRRTRLAMSTNMCVTNFAELGPAIAIGAIDVVLTDPWYWGGPTQVRALDTVARTMGIGLSMHSGIELGIGMAVMAHTGVTMPGLTAAVDAHYHHLTDDVIAGDMLLPQNGALYPPAGAGWGVDLDIDKVAQYQEVHASGVYRNVYIEANSAGPDPERPTWRPIIPAW